MSPSVPVQMFAAADDLLAHRAWVPEGSLAGHFRADFRRCFAKSTPGTPLDRRGSPRTSVCTENQPRRPTLRPNGGELKILPDCLQVPREQNNGALLSEPVHAGCAWIPRDLMAASHSDSETSSVPRGQPAAP